MAFKVRSKIISMGGLRLGNTTTALTAAKLGTSNWGEIRLGYNAGSIQIGLVIQGTAFVLQGTANGGLTIVRNP